jgi:hypothetical protein
LHALTQSRGRLLVVGAKVREGEDKARRAGLAIQQRQTDSVCQKALVRELEQMPRESCPRRMEPAGPTTVISSARSGIRKKTVSPISSDLVDAARGKKRLEPK